MKPLKDKKLHQVQFFQRTVIEVLKKASRSQRYKIVGKLKFDFERYPSGPFVELILISSELSISSVLSHAFVSSQRQQHPPSPVPLHLISV